MWISWYSEIFISTYIPAYKGNSLRKSLHNHRCYFGFTFEVRFCHVISLICIAISEIGIANSQVSKPNALMCWFSQLICVSLGGFDTNRTHNISTLQNLKKIVTANLMRRGVLQCSRASRPRFPVSDIPAAVALRASYISDRQLVREFRRHDVRQSKHNCWEVGGFNCTGYTPWNTERFDISVIQFRNT